MLAGVDEALDQLRPKLARWKEGGAVRPQLVRGPPASGRSLLLKAVAREAQELGLPVVELTLPPLDRDAPVHVLFQLAALAPDLSAPVFELRAPWDQRLAAAIKGLASDEPRVLLLRLPPSWQAPMDPEGAELQFHQEASELLLALLGPEVRILPIVALDRGRWPGSPLRAPEELRLEITSPADEFLSDPAWGDLAPTARDLLDLLGKSARDCSLLQLRLAVALLHYGFDSAGIRRAIRSGSTLRDIEPLLKELLHSRPALQRALRSVAVSRFPLPRDQMLSLAATESETIREQSEDWIVLERCFLYPTESGKELRFHENLRWLTDLRKVPVNSHRMLRDHYAALDGVTDPRQGVQNWLPYLEKLHHANYSYPDGEVEHWLALNPPSREHFWEYGWALSYCHQRYEAAARVFRELLNRCGDDDNYGQHYYAYNLDKAGRQSQEAERYYRLAVEGDRSNPWWNARYISFLTQRGKQQDARRAWNAALAVIDPEGDRSGGDWLPYHLHKHIIEAALDAGDLELAELALTAVRPPASELSPFPLLGDRLDAFKEVRRLGEAFFPADEPHVRWWSAPRLLGQVMPGEEPQRWFPGRVLQVADDRVELALGERTPGQHPRARYQTVTREEWNRFTRLGADAPPIPPEEGQFIELGHYQDRIRIAVENAPTPAEMKAGEALERLRYHLRFLASSGTEFG